MSCGNKRVASIDSMQITCKIPCVAEYSTSISRFRNQILNQVLADLRCNISPSISPVNHPVVLSETSHLLNESLAINLEVEGISIISVDDSLQNVSFKIIGFSSAIVRVSGDIVSTINYYGTDALNHSQKIIVPFSRDITIPGNYPHDAYVEGNIKIDRIQNNLVLDVSHTKIIAVNSDLAMTEQIRILVYQPDSQGQTQLLSDTSHNLIVPHTLDLSVFAEQILATGLSVRNALFEITGLSPAQVRISGDAVLTVDYLGVDSFPHTEQQTIPFTVTETIPGNFPPNSFISGSVVLDDMLIVPEEDPSITGIASLAATLFLTVLLRIMATT